MALYSVHKYHGRYALLIQEDFITLDAISDVSERMVKMTQMIELTEAECNERRAYCAEIREMLRKFYPDCLVLIFGSTINGFGCKHCDLDLLFLPFPGYCNLDFAPPEGTGSGKKSDTVIPEPESVLNGETSQDVLSKFDEWSHLKFLRVVLRREKKIKKVNFIPAKNPTLKILLQNNKVLGDLSASNRLVVFNSELLQFLGKLDPRVKPLVTCLRFWARSLGYIKRSFFTSYAFTLLVIFFLQNTNPPILPSVKMLIDASGFSRMTAGWQTAFVTDVNAVPKTTNTKTLAELMLQFFEYYWNFDFVTNAVCPYSGKVQSVKDLRSSEDSRMAEFEVSSLHIQDVFILSRNVCKADSSRIVFKLALHAAYEMLKANKETIQFQKLFDFNEYQKTLDLHYEKYMMGKPKVCFINLDYHCITNLSKTTKMFSHGMAKPLMLCLMFCSMVF